MNIYQGKTGEEYYAMRHQRRNDFIQKRRASHFQPFISKTDHVLDFGCGTGGILHYLQCGQKTGIEVNESSIAEAKQRGLTLYPDIAAIADNSIDIVISNHALEHVQNPFSILLEFKRILKSGGKVILVVPAESPFQKRFCQWASSDPDHHIYSWTPLSFGNLINQSGLKTEQGFYRPIGYSKFNQPLAKWNEALFQLSRKLISFFLRRYEIVCIAKKI